MRYHAERVECLWVMLMLMRMRIRLCVCILDLHVDFLDVECWILGFLGLHLWLGFEYWVYE